MSNSDTISLLRNLSKIISDGVDKIDQTCTELNLQFPSPDEPFTPASHAAHLDPEISEAVFRIIAAASQITAVAQPAPVTLFTTASQFHTSAAIRTVIVTNTVEILREAGPQGLHINDIAAKNGTHPAKLGRILRLLATQHIFKELAPDVFTNNRISSVMDTYKDVAEINASPQDKHKGTPGPAALVQHFTDEAMKSSAFMAEGVTKPGYALSDDPAKAAFNIAFGTELGVFQWYELPENEERRRTFQVAFEGGKNMFNPRQILEGFDWAVIPNGTVVDVGGGVGTQSLTVAREYPDMNFVIQDLPSVIEDAKKLWADSMPEALQSGRVVLQVNDFFKEQPIKGADVYYLSMILHDWADSYCLQILELLRKAAAPTTRLLISESILSYACEDTTVAQDIPGGIGPVPPQPLLPNWGCANLSTQLVNNQMMTLMNGVERTLAQFVSLLLQAGWKVVRVYRSQGASHLHHQILAVVV